MQAHRILSGSLIAEGTLDETGEIIFYSIDETIDELWQYIG